MMHLTKIALVALALLAGRTGALGQTLSDSSDLRKSSPGAERSRMNFLVGSFATSTYIPPPPSMAQGATGQGTSVIAWTLDSMFLAIEEESVNPLFGHYRGHGMLGYDPQTRQFVLSMFNNFGDRPVYRGNFAGDTLVLQTRVPAPKGTFDQKLLWYRDGDTVKLKVLNDFGKGSVLALEETSTPQSQRTK